MQTAKGKNQKPKTKNKKQKTKTKKSQNYKIKKCFLIFKVPF
jgi:hypothetical protein